MVFRQTLPILDLRQPLLVFDRNANENTTANRIDCTAPPGTGNVRTNRLNAVVNHHYSISSNPGSIFAQPGFNVSDQGCRIGGSVYLDFADSFM